MTTGLKFYAVRRFTSGAVLGSRAMTEAEATAEVASWCEHIGPAARVPDMPEVRRAVRADDQAALWRFLLDFEPRVWVSCGSHRARGKLDRLAEAERLGTLVSWGTWPKSGGWPRGEYYQMPARLRGQLERIKGVRILAGEPAGKLFKRWTMHEDGSPLPGNWPVPA